MQSLIATIRVVSVAVRRPASIKTPLAPEITPTTPAEGGFNRRRH